jgi:hypothetical protein
VSASFCEPRFLVSLLQCPWSSKQLFAIELMDSRSKELVQTISERPYWFESCEEQHLSSAATNSVEEDWENWTGPTQYDPPSGASLPFTVIKDNTEGIAGIADLVFPANANTFLDIGGGRFNATGQWLKRQRKGAEYHVLDPFNRFVALHLFFV